MVGAGEVQQQRRGRRESQLLSGGQRMKAQVAPGVRDRPTSGSDFALA